MGGPCAIAVHSALHRATAARRADITPGPRLIGPLPASMRPVWLQAPLCPVSIGAPTFFSPAPLPPSTAPPAPIAAHCPLSDLRESWIQPRIPRSQLEAQDEKSQTRELLGRPLRFPTRQPRGHTISSAVCRDKQALLESGICLPMIPSLALAPVACTSMRRDLQPGASSSCAAYGVHSTALTISVICPRAKTPAGVIRIARSILRIPR